MPLGSQVTIQYQDHTWNARVADAIPSEDSDTTDLQLTTLEGDPLVCGKDCGILPGAQTFSITSTVTVEEPTEGPALPAAAVTTRTDGTSFVTINGKKRTVEVLASGSGMLILSGVELGERAEIPVGRSTGTHTKTPSSAHESDGDAPQEDSSSSPREGTEPTPSSAGE